MGRRARIQIMDATFEMTFFHAPADPDTLTPGAAAPAVTDALNAWNTGACSGIRFEDGGEVEAGDPSFDGLNGIYWDDPAHNIEADILAVTYTVGTTDAGPGDPDRLEVDIVLNDGLRWYTEAEIAAGECTDGYSILGALIHELGHGAHVDHDNAGAAMDWSSSGACAAAVLPDAHDLAALRAVWGPTVSVVCEDPANTPVPVSVTCIATPSDGATGEVTWTAGALTAEGDTATFLFEEGGVVTVSACATFSDCGDEAICGSMDLALTDLSSVRPGDADEDHVPTGCGACAGARSRPSGPLLTMVLVGALAALRRPYRSFTSS